ncbi:MAG: hypothetical protein ACYC6Y_24970 [Thermoguttaceae bacterium]
MCPQKKPDNIYSPDFIRQKLRALPRETTPRRITAPIKRFCRTIVPDRLPDFVPVLAAPNAQPNAAHRNVEDTIGANGGGHAPGWLIWEMRGVLLNAERYICWRSPEGIVIDVSPKPDGEKRILFLEGSDPWDGSRVCPATAPLVDDPPVLEYVRVYQAERRQWAIEVTDFKLQKQLYLAMVAMSDHLATRKKGGR